MCGRSGIGTVICCNTSVLLVGIIPSCPKLCFIHPSLMLCVLNKWPDIKEETATFPCQSFIFRQRSREVIISEEN